MIFDEHIYSCKNEVSHDFSELLNYSFIKVETLM